MVSKELLEILICPACHGELEYDSAADTLTCRGSHCASCGMPVDAQGHCDNSECSQTSSGLVGLRFHVEENIPVMLIDEAEKIAL
ncbi:MAG TPA: Trm112 family protein [bacterium]|nr:Trm112 family protein [bacterium]HPR87268.1 Trm112 family protein [bacterium]